MLFDLRFGHGLKKSKKVRAWSLGILGSVGLISVVTVWGAREPLRVTVVGREIDEFGNASVVVLISNTTQRAWAGYAMCQSLIDREWVSRLGINPATGLPGGVDFSVGPGQSAMWGLPEPVSGEQWRVAVVRTRVPGGAEALLMKSFAKLRIKYPFDLRVERYVECKQ